VDTEYNEMVVIFSINDRIGSLCKQIFFDYFSERFEMGNNKCGERAQSEALQTKYRYWSMTERGVRYGKYYSSGRVRRQPYRISRTPDIIYIWYTGAVGLRREERGERSLGGWIVAVETVSGASAVRQSYKRGPICIVADDQLRREAIAAHPWLRLVDEGARRKNLHKHIYSRDNIIIK
jgi:hypothetical protein